MRKELGMHAAWLPVTNTFRVGDYGLISEGVLVKAGNIKDDFGIPFTTAPGPDSDLKANSKGVREVRVEGGAQVTTFSNAPVSAKISIEFAEESSFFVKAKISLVEMQNLREVANRLAAHPEWERKYRVVSAVYVGKDCTIVSSKSAKSKIELAGEAKALQQFDLAGATANVHVGLREDIGVEVIGKNGPIALGLFKLHWLTGGPQTLATGDAAFETHAKWGDVADDV